MKNTARVPQYRRHARGQAIVKYQGRTIYLGKYGTEDSRIRYRRFLEQLEVRKKYEKL